VRSNACNPLAPRIDKNLGNPVVKKVWVRTLAGRRGILILSVNRADGDEGDTPYWSNVMASSRAGARKAPVPFSRVLASSFGGAACGSYESGRHSVTKLTLSLPHSVVQWRG
jgi:hypothetical protein